MSRFTYVHTLYSGNYLVNFDTVLSNNKQLSYDHEENFSLVTFNFEMIHISLILTVTLLNTQYRPGTCICCSANPTVQRREDFYLHIIVCIRSLSEKHERIIKNQKQYPSPPSFTICTPLVIYYQTSLFTAAFNPSLASLIVIDHHVMWLDRTRRT